MTDILTVDTQSQNVTKSDTPAVVIKDLHKSFGNLQVLKGVDMTVNPGSVTVILGPSGSGKSTLLRLINQLEKLRLVKSQFMASALA